ncbi:DUF1659 domain-containing protein [Priestia taiwanensis]|uniref:DUF1659 domain-containing protein n=1 Tax=Priestia taiwanensis TaxID=1347902 RepID=A0A917ARP6_9BACI|nr:DUF1659 domain-containing protein [Priestia taiwanensis]MBM7363304.1 hypothetical protein [Priestia taiwanensis]GGE69311.1 hypothetical protein GCM10007140_19220 [Priestia taiwanensis]
MANETKKLLTLQLEFKVGEGSEGEVLVKRKTYRNIRPAASAAEVLPIAQAIASLQTLSLHEVNTIVTSELTN